MSLVQQEPYPKDDPGNAGCRSPADQGANTNPALTPSMSPSNPPKPPTSAAQPKPKRYDGHKVITSVVEVVGLTVLIVYTIFSCLQWLQIRWTNRLTREALNSSDVTLEQTLSKMQGQIEATNNLRGETKRQADETKRSADSAKQALRNATIQFVQDQRPYLWLDAEAEHTQDYPVHFVPGVDGRDGVIACDIWIKNFGRSPAINVRSTTYLSIASDSEDDIDWSEMPKTGGGVYPPTTKFFKTARTKKLYDRSVLEVFTHPVGPLNKNSGSLTIHVLLKYSDQFGGNYTSEICEAIQRNGIEKRCTSHNYMK